MHVSYGFLPPFCLAETISVLSFSLRTLINLILELRILPPEPLGPIPAAGWRIHIHPAIGWVLRF